MNFEHGIFVHGTFYMEQNLVLSDEGDEEEVSKILHAEM